MTNWLDTNPKILSHENHSQEQVTPYENWQNNRWDENENFDTDDHSGYLQIEGVSGNYVFSQMKTSHLLEYIEAIDSWIYK